MSEISETEIKAMTKEQNYIRGYKDGKSDVLDKIREEIEQIEINGHIRDIECFSAGINAALKIIDKYNARKEVKKNEPRCRYDCYLQSRKLPV